METLNDKKSRVPHTYVIILGVRGYFLLDAKPYHGLDFLFHDVIRFLYRFPIFLKILSKKLRDFAASLSGSLHGKSGGAPISESWISV